MLRLAVLASGGGTNLQAIIDAVESGELKASIEMVITDRPAGALQRAKQHQIPGFMLDRKIHKKELSHEIDKKISGNVDMVVLAGYLSILSNSFIKKWNRKVINIHPSLLPDFGGKGMYGMNVHNAVINSKKKESGCTVHFVDQDIDTGEIIIQQKVKVSSEDTPESLQKKVLKEEHPLLVKALQKFV